MKSPFSASRTGFGFVCGEAGNVGSDRNDGRGAKVRVDCESGREEKAAVV